MAYAKAHPFGYKAVKNFTGKPASTPQDKKHKQTIIAVTTYQVRRRSMVWRTDPKTGKKRMVLVPVTDSLGRPAYDRYYGSQTREVKHFGRVPKGKTYAEMVYESFPLGSK